MNLRNSVRNALSGLSSEALSTENEEHGREESNNNHNKRRFRDDDVSMVHSMTEGSEGESLDEVEEIKNLSKRETSKIRFWRFVVTIVIVGTGALVSTGTFLYIRELENENARDAFVLFSNTIEDISRFHFKNMFEASRAMSREMSAAAVLAKQSFPFVSFPNYEVYATQAREAAGLEVISYAPVVTLEQADAFVNYTVDNQKWISDSRKLGMKLDPNLTFEDIDNTQFNPVIYDVNPLAGDTFPSEGEGPFATLWHTSPPPQSLIYFLYNFASDPEYTTIFALMEEFRDTLFGNTNFFLGTVVDFIVGANKHQHLHEARHYQAGTQVNITQPHCSLVQPVFASLEHDDAPIAGYIMGIMAFDAYLINLLPDGVRGIYVVVQNTCGAVFTYRLNGNQAEWMGEGDLHEPIDDEKAFVRTIDFDDNYRNPTIVNVPGHCVFSYQVYPSNTFNADYSSRLPILLSCAMAALFLLMAIAFHVLMHLVDQRQDKVVGEAAISNAIVSSLFPSSVRKRLFADRAALLPQEASDSGKSALRSFLQGEAQEVLDDGNGLVLKAKPIADLFRECTVMCK